MSILSDYLARLPLGHQRSSMRHASFLLNVIQPLLEATDDPASLRVGALRALDRAALAFPAIEQNILDSGSWDVAWRLTQLPVPTVSTPFEEDPGLTDGTAYCVNKALGQAVVQEMTAAAALKSRRDALSKKKGNH